MNTKHKLVKICFKKTVLTCFGLFSERGKNSPPSHISGEGGGCGVLQSEKAPLQLTFRVREGVVVEGGCREKGSKNTPPTRVWSEEGGSGGGGAGKQKAPLQLAFGAREGVKSGVCMQSKIFIRIKKTEGKKHT